ncbi:MAG TPA: hypothetical protein VMF12_00680 [Xanthobacteraceae bacterium]|nr:hypothetical protein [Xanthobacteraceae bacterium]
MTVFSFSQRPKRNFYLMVKLMPLASKFLGLSCAILTAALWVVTLMTGPALDSIGAAVGLTAIVVVTFWLSLSP